MLDAKTNAAFQEAIDLDDVIVFDIEATSANVDEAEIIQIAAIHPTKGIFNTFVKTETELSADNKVWDITKIDFGDYQKAVGTKDCSLATILKAFFEYIEDKPLAGHNIERYDIPLLKRQLQKCGLVLSENLLTLDSLQWSLVRYPTPPNGLRGYKLGDLYEFFTGQGIDGAHQADKDCEANLVVLKPNLKQKVHGRYHLVSCKSCCRFTAQKGFKAIKYLHGLFAELQTNPSGTSFTKLLNASVRTNQLSIMQNHYGVTYV